MLLRKLGWSSRAKYTRTMAQRRAMWKSHSPWSTEMLTWICWCSRSMTPRIVVFFPTIVPTNLGFLVQGPYRTTPSRDNVPPNDPWNQKLVKETATLLVKSLPALRDMGLLDVGALRSLPLDGSKFGEASRFRAAV